MPPTKTHYPYGNRGMTLCSRWTVIKGERTEVPEEVTCATCRRALESRGLIWKK